MKDTCPAVDGAVAVACATLPHFVAAAAAPGHTGPASLPPFGRLGDGTLPLPAAPTTTFMRADYPASFILGCCPSAQVADRFVPTVRPLDQSELRRAYRKPFTVFPLN